MFDHEYITPIVKVSPKEAFFAPQKSVEIEKSEGFISAEFVMCYPPGIPIIAPGELITSEILEYVAYSKDRGCMLTGTEDMAIERINVLTD